ncbi:hypothetical protein ACRAVF_26860 [Bradyrhizobium oligotrophicum S58]
MPGFNGAACKMFLFCSIVRQYSWFGCFMRDLCVVRAEIDRMRLQVMRQRREIVQLRRAGASTTAADALLHHMLETLGRLRKQREQLKLEEASRMPRKQRGARRA